VSSSAAQIAAPSSSSSSSTAAAVSPIVSPTPGQGVVDPEHKQRKTKKKKRKNNSNSNDASISSGNSAQSVSGALNSSGTLEGGVPFPTPRLEDDDSFELNTTYV